MKKSNPVVMVPPELKGQLLALLKAHFTIEVGDSGNFYSPNQRTICVNFDGEEVASATFDVADKPESEW